MAAKTVVAQSKEKKSSAPTKAAAPSTKKKTETALTKVVKSPTETAIPLTTAKHTATTVGCKKVSEQVKKRIVSAIAKYLREEVLKAVDSKPENRLTLYVQDIK